MRHVAALTFLALIVAAVQAQEYASPLSDNSCSQDEKSLTAIEGVKVVASCGPEGSMRAMYIAVTNTAPAERGALRAVSIGFCGADAVISEDSPAGWSAEVFRSKTKSGVKWTVPNAAMAERGLRSGQRADGFVVRLRPGWSRSSEASALWESKGTGHIMSHDCGESDMPR
jgi:hypothetical protein